MEPTKALCPIFTERCRTYIDEAMAMSIPKKHGHSVGSAKPDGNRDDETSTFPGPHPEAAPRGRGRPKLMSDEQQAAAIARQARDLFLQKGYARTAMEDIATRCRISKSTLYRLFPNKTEIFGAIVDDHRHSMLALPGDYGDLPLEEAIARIFLIDIDEDAHRKRMEVVRLVMVEGYQFPELHDLLRERGGDTSRAMLSEWLKAQDRRGRIDIECADTTAWMLMDIMFGALMPKGGKGAEWFGGDDRRIHLRRSIRIFVNGIRPR